MSGRAWDRAAAAHTLGRAGFGASLEALDAAVSAGRQATLEQLIERDACDPVLSKGLSGVLATEDIAPLSAWWMARLLGDGAPFVERVALMWHNHFATSFAKVRDTRLMHAQVQLLRDHGRGDFRELLGKVARDPAMLLWLDGNENRLGSPNENFAREVLELFALGLGAYEELDVQEAARAFTGWGVDRRHFVNRERYHDAGDKTILGQSGAMDGDQVLELILGSPACPRWVARRLLTEFVHPSPSEDEITTWSQVLIANDWHVQRTLEQLFASDLFLSPRARRSRIAGPVELLVGTALRLGVRTVPRRASRAVADMGQALFMPPSVKGWPGGRTWIHAGTWLARHNTLVDLAQRAADGGLDWSHADMLDALMPDGAPAALAAALRQTPKTADALALILTTPEAQLA